MAFVTYFFFRIFSGLFSLLPFPVLYGLSNFLYFIFYKVLKYRKKVVQSNLKKSFPNKSEKELLAIEKGFYKNLSDITVESIKGFSLSKKSIMKRYHLINPEFLDSYKDKNILLVAGHFSNWEWGAIAAGEMLKSFERVLGFYKPLSNKHMDKYVRKTRGNLGTNLVSIKNTYEVFEENVPHHSAFIMVADQSPSRVAKSHWMTFLNQDTVCLHGPEKYCKTHKLPMLFLDIKRIKRGYYTVTLSELYDGSTPTKEGEITEYFMRKLEQRIIEEPSNWLWSHKRWKKKREKNN